MFKLQPVRLDISVWEILERLLKRRAHMLLLFFSFLLLLVLNMVAGVPAAILDQEEIDLLSSVQAKHQKKSQQTKQQKPELFHNFLLNTKF